MRGYVVAFVAVGVFSWLVAAGMDTIESKAVTPQGVRAQRMDEGTFRVRWASVADMPPMREREVIDNSVLLVSTEPMAVAGSPVRPPLLGRRAALHSDICVRHHMRRVTVRHGRWTGWRCRR